jgi:hypothetical protein
MRLGVDKLVYDKTVTFQKKKKISGQKSQIGLDTKTYWLTDCQLQSNSDSDSDLLIHCFPVLRDVQIPFIDFKGNLVTFTVIDRVNLTVRRSKFAGWLRPWHFWSLFPLWPIRISIGPCAVHVDDFRGFRQFLQAYAWMVPVVMPGTLSSKLFPDFCVYTALLFDAV